MKDKAFNDDPLWYKDALIYELHVRAFRDSNEDGIGDFAGLTEKLDYLQDLGVTALWLLPFYPSPLKDDGYDISDYADVHPAYGNLRDFKDFLKEAHARGLRVINELVLNHTSDQHVWFQRARRAKRGKALRDFYVWSPASDRYKDARVIFKDFESSNWTWDPAAGEYYWHRFYSHQPDLNFDNPRVHRALLQAVDFWLGAGVDGMRLDAVPYLYEREATNCENLPETHAFLKHLRRHVDGRYKDRMFLAEANQWPEDASAYFGSGDECHMSFHFPLMPRLFMAMRMEDRYPIYEILQQTPAIPETCQWALFLRNHDELTLEMVTDEDRDYMYRTYAQDPQARVNLGIRRRLAPLLGNNRRRIELMNGLLFSLPGTPVLYYGDEIGMGDNIYLGDRNAVRTPMQWSADRNAGFSRANPQRLYLPVIVDPEYHYEALNVEAQQANTQSLLWWTKRLIALRKRHKAFGRGSLEFLQPENRKILAFLRRYDDETILVVANLSRFAQYAELDLSALKGRVPLELFGRTNFPPIGDLPYLLTLGPHGFYWFKMETPTPAVVQEPAPAELPKAASKVEVAELEDLFQGAPKEALAEALGAYLRAHVPEPKGKRLKTAGILEAVPVAPDLFLALAWAEYSEGEPEAYQVPLAWTAAELGSHPPVLRAKVGGKEGVLYEAFGEPRLWSTLLEAVLRRRRISGRVGRLQAWPAARTSARGEPPTSIKVEHTNVVATFGDKTFFKLYRRLEPGLNPELEIARFLTKKAFPHSPALQGALEYRRAGQAMTLGTAFQFVRHETDAWGLSLDSMDQYLERVLERRSQAGKPAPELASELLGHYFEQVRLMGKRTAEFHRALAAEDSDPAFIPEPFTDHYRLALFHGMIGHMEQAFRLLRSASKHLPEYLQADAQSVLDRGAEVRERFVRLRAGRVQAYRTRCHGDFRLGQLLYTGKDFVIIDFEGDPSRPMGWRRLKSSPLRDVAAMMRSFHHAASAAVDRRGLPVRAEEAAGFEAWADAGRRWVSDAFLKSYFEAASGASFLPQDPSQAKVLLEAYWMERCLNELTADAASRPHATRLALRGILQLLEGT